MVKATENPTSTSPTSQLTPDEMRGLAARLRARAQSVLLRHQPEQHRDLLTAASLIEGLARSADLLVDITDTEGKVRRSIPLREAIGDDDVEYRDCRANLLAD